MAGTPGTTTAAGTALLISAGAPATQDKAGYVALAFTEIGSIEKIGTIGAVAAKVEFTPLKGAKQKFKGSVDYGSLQPSLAHDPSDAGQTLLRAAATSNNNYAFQVTLPTGDVLYFQARVFGYSEDIQGADTVVMANPTAEINTPIVYVPAGG